MSREMHVRTFNYNNVQLKDSHWKRQFDKTKQYYLDIPDDNLLYGFRKRAGLPAPGEELGGWYATGTFHIFGQILGSLAKMYAATKEESLKNKAICLMEEWGKCIEADGYGFKNKRGAVFDVCYEYEKLTGGLLDIYEHIGNDESLKYLSRISDWMINNDVNKRAGEWYTLAENLYRAYLITGDEKYRKLAEDFEYMEYWKLYLEDNAKFGVRHAYSHVNSLSSAAMAYAVKHDEIYLEIIKKAYKLLTEKHIFATGTYGPAEELFKEDGYLGEAVLRPLVRQLGCLGDAEVPCGSWAVFKLCKYLIQFTGDLSFGDWVEKILYNGIGAEISLEPGGRVMYYCNYKVYGAYKDVKSDHYCWDNGNTQAWQCCTGTYPQAVTEYYNLVYYHDDEGIYISQYLPSSVKWQKGGEDVIIDMDTMYPENGKVEIKISCKRPTRFKMKLRVPTWVKSMPKVTINGISENNHNNSNAWIEIEREWKNDDKVVLNIPMHLYFTSVDKPHYYLVALHYGPVVYASLDDGVLVGDTSNPHLWIKPVGKENQLFETVNGHVKGYENIKKRFVPFYKIRPRERYYLYNEWDAGYKK